MPHAACQPPNPLALICAAQHKWPSHCAASQEAARNLEACCWRGPGASQLADDWTHLACSHLHLLALPATSSLLNFAALGPAGFPCSLFSRVFFPLYGANEPLYLFVSVDPSLFVVLFGWFLFCSKSNSSGVWRGTEEKGPRLQSKQSACHPLLRLTPPTPRHNDTATPGRQEPPAR